jgi:hypothetical protein
MEIGKLSLIGRIGPLVIWMVLSGCTSLRHNKANESCAEVYQKILNLPQSPEKSRGQSVDSEILAGMYENRECFIDKPKSKIRSIFGSPSKAFSNELRYYSQGEYPCKKRCVWLSFSFDKEGKLQKFERRGESIHID